MDLLIFGGQSNMQGQSECLSEDRPVARACEYRFLEDRTVPLKNPVGENITFSGEEGVCFQEGTDGADWLAVHALGAACYGHTNLVPAFCRAYLTHTEGKVMAVHTAKGSTTVSQWLPGTGEYAALKKKVLAAKKACAPCGIDRICFIWLQGESDAISGTACADYKAKLRLLRDSLKQDLAIDLFGIIRVGRFTGDARDLEIMRAQDELCREDEDFQMLTDIAVQLNDRPDCMHPETGGHYSAKGLEILGAAAGTALGTFCAAQKP